VEANRKIDLEKLDMLEKLLEQKNRTIEELTLKFQSLPNFETMLTHQAAAKLR
jgi:hypothetical protein